MRLYIQISQGSVTTNSKGRW